MRIATCVLALLFTTTPAFAQDMPADYAAVLKALNRTGDFRGQVLRVNVPRSDLTVSVAGAIVPMALGFGGWLAMTRGDGGMDVMTGDLVLTESEINPVMSAVLDAGLDVTALHNHFLRETPRIYYMHVHGVGAAADLAKRVRPALDLIGRDPFGVPGASGEPLAAGPLSADRLAQVIGHPGEQTGAVFKITIGRDDLDMREHGARIEARMGLNTWAAFAGSDDDAVVAGDVAMLGAEVTPVLQALRGAGLHVVALHHHMTTGSPTIYFVHYWGRGRAAALAQGVRAALDRLPAKQ